MNPLHGAATALITPFTADLHIDFDALERIVNHQIENGTQYLVVLGTTGESATLSASEKQAVMKAVVQYNKGRVPLVIGMGGNDTAALLTQLSETDFSGYSYVLSVSPYYNKPNQRGIIAHYQAVAEHSPLPVIIYNVPGRTGSNMTAETQLILAQHPRIVATKEASGNMEQIMHLLQHKPDNFEVISGDDSLTFPMMALGATGVISVINHAYPKVFSGMVADCLSGNWEAAKQAHYEILEGSIRIFEDGSPGGIKVMLHQMGLCETFVRPPLYPVNEKLEQILRSLVK
jgi:4-hydroxy-tetrahydrodipicolinate synthase